jgi:phosphoglycerate kinase
MTESLMPVAERLAELIGRPVILPEDCIGDAVKKLAHEIREGDVLLLENLRFHDEEEGNDAAFAQSLAQSGEVYVGDAFGTMHRAHASTVGMVKHFKEKGIGLLVKKELEYLSPLLARPARPYVAVLGGVKVSDKIELIEHMLTKVDELLLGGSLAYLFLKALGQPIGKSKCEDDKVYLAQKILQKAKENDIPIRLPVDHRVADKPAADAVVTVSAKIPEGKMGLDIGPETARQYGEILTKAKTVFWNGPMGVFEFPQVAEGSLAVVRAIASGDSVSIVGGGESLALVKMSGLGDHITHLSTGGGASMKFLEGKGLPGLAALEV